MESGVLIYDDGALERLLDRDTLSRIKETSKIVEECGDDLDSSPIVFSPCSKENVNASTQNYQGGDERYFPTDAKERSVGNYFLLAVVFTLRKAVSMQVSFMDGDMIL